MSRVLIIGSHTPISREIGRALTAAHLPTVYSAGPADALKRLRTRRFDVVITSADSDIDENLALLEEMRSIRPDLKCIVLAQYSTPDKVIAALKARVFGCFTPPFDTQEIATLVASAASDNQSNDDIEILSARPGWVSIRANCRLVTAERLLSFAKELSAQLPEDARQEIIQAFREILMNAMEHGAKFNPEQVVEVNAIRTARTMVFRVRDPGTGFQKESLAHAAIANPDTDPTAHILLRKEQGMRAGGYGLLLASGTVDELIYNAIGNEVILIKYLDTTAHNDKP
ncbi:ATP-binding protein [Tunturiibacter psychrotolerans]|uniref:ATP-binding protein n=1 Tax=Tunturiibacter psychrotolerans TaxID=3069686 RepID=UPI003D21A5D0